MKELINALKPFFPVTYNLDNYVVLSFASNAELFTMLAKIAIYLVVGIVVGAILGVIGAILPILAFVWWVIGVVAELYIVIGIVLVVLDYLKVFDK